ncbi:MAG: twin-arginine translocation signal domain-containing protein, partial [Verrucomicrobia bacterium]|nr:twin-arginine translocation signal domain-containing protein [Verrucomicrobiota bacterium]
MKRVLKPTSRRNFLKEMLLGGTACAVLPSYVLGLHGETSPNSKLAIAFVGIGGRGGHNLNGLCGEKVVALCDVD